MKKEMIEYLEQGHNIFIDGKTQQYNRQSRDAVYGWLPIPAEWLHSTEECHECGDTYTVPADRSYHNMCQECFDSIQAQIAEEMDLERMHDQYDWVEEYQQEYNARIKSDVEAFNNY